MAQLVRRCSCRRWFVLYGAVLLATSLLAQSPRKIPTKVPPKRTSQIQDGFGINSDLPRDPYLPINSWWWTRMK